MAADIGHTPEQVIHNGTTLPNLETKQKTTEESGTMKPLDIFVENSGVLFKGTPLFIGFIIFFLYFCQNSFFPSIDLFGITSLLISAFLLGTAVVVSIMLGLVFPGWSWTDACLRQNEKLWTTHVDSSKKPWFRYTNIILKCFAIPLIICSATTALAWIFISDIRILLVATIGLPIVTGGIAGLLEGKIYKLPPPFRIECGFATFISLIMTNIICLLTLWTLQATQFPDHAEVIPWVAGISWLLGSMIVIVNALASQLGLKYWMAISLLVTLLAMMATQMPTSLPPKIMAILGVGHYPAKQIILNEDACKALKGSIVSTENCAIENPWIIWSAGDIFKIRLNVRTFIDTHTTCKSCEKGLCSNDLIISKDSVAAIIR